MFMKDATAMPTSTTSLHRGYTVRQPSRASHISSAPMPPKTSRPMTSGSAPIDVNHARPETSFETAALNALKRGLIFSRSSSIFSRNRESRSEPSPMTPFATLATDFSHGVSSTSVPRESSRSATRSVRRPAQISRSVVTGSRLVVPASDQVEEGRGELERPRLSALPEERGHERRLGRGRRLLLVLAVVAGAELATERPEDERRDEEGGDRAKREQDQSGTPWVLLRVLDALLVLLVLGRVRLLLGDDLPEPVAFDDAHACGRGECLAWVDGPELDELMGGDVECAQHGIAAVEGHITAHPHRVAPGLEDVAGAAHRASEPAERHRPLIAPDLEIDVDDVVVADRETREAVAQREGARAAVRLEPPDDANLARRLLDAERARRAAGLEGGRGAWPERLPVLADRDGADVLALAERNVAVPVGEGAAEEDGDHFLHRNGAVALDDRSDRRIGEGDGPGPGAPGEGQRDKRRSCKEEERLRLDVGYRQHG